MPDLRHVVFEVNKVWRQVAQKCDCVDLPLAAITPNLFLCFAPFFPSYSRKLWKPCWMAWVKSGISWHLWQNLRSRTLRFMLGDGLGPLVFSG